MGEEQPGEGKGDRESMAGEEPRETQSQRESATGEEESGRSEFSHQRTGESESAQSEETQRGECVVVSREWLRGMIEKAYHAGAKDVMDGVYE